MFLKRLEMQGFKSFPEKIRLEFPQGITAVVGPNGSGKSNISDALRWVLGEQSVKTLRGGKMEDVIFAGTSGRRALGFAEASITLDNADSKIPSEYSEITVTRRVFRSGEGQFFINGTACRLKDVHALFMDTGIGRDGYSIIGQGQIDEVLSAKSEQRRLLFEEAAGIVKYKARKKETEDNLEREARNLERAQDIIAELESQIEPLRIDAEKTKRFLELSERLKTLKINIFVRREKKLADDAENAEKDCADLAEQIDNISRERKDEKQSHEAAKAQIDEMTDAALKITEQSNEAAINAEKAEADVKVCEERIEYYRKDIDRLSLSAEFDLTALYEKERGFKLSLAEREEAVTEKQEELSQKEVLGAKLSEQLTDKEAEAAQSESKHQDRLKSDSEIKERLLRAQVLYETLEENMETAAEEREAAALSAKSTEEAIEAANEEISKIAERESFIRSNNEAAIKEKTEAEQKLAAVSGELTTATKTLGDITARLKFLKELESKYEGYYNSVKAVLAAKERNPAKFSGVLGVVGNLITVPQRYETAIETALGGAIDDIVTNDEDAAKTAIAFLKETKSGRATFLPLSSIKGGRTDGAKFAAEPGFLGVGDEVIGFLLIYAKVFENLLGRTLIFDNLDNAVLFSKKYRYSFRCVTLQGEILNTGGSITGGSSGKASAGILSRAREISGLTVDAKEANEILTEHKKEHDEVSSIVSSLEETISKNNFKLHEEQLKLAGLVAKGKEAERNAAKEAARLDKARQAEAEISRKIEEQNLLLREIKSEREKSEAQISDVLAETESFRTEILRLRKEKEKFDKEIVSARLSLKDAENAAKEKHEELSRLLSDIEKYKTEAEQARADIEGLEKETELTREKIKELRDVIEDLNLSVTVSDMKIKEINQKRDELKTKLPVFENADMDFEQRLSELGKDSVRLQAKRDGYNEERRRLCDEIWEEYTLTPQSAAKTEMLTQTLPTIEREKKLTEDEIDKMGAINPKAVEEYKVKLERFTLLKEQSEDIIAAEDKLRKIIEELSELMKNQFNEKLEIISKNFGETFAALFGGGTARLELSDKTDTLNSGVDIVAQMPGKNLKSMSLFSGGERALTAIALLFGILKMNPAPFCVLDEIEAALDDANVSRFANFLKNFAVQFIVITHRKGTMEAADVLYGVTMQEVGVSKLISVAFENSPQDIGENIDGRSANIG
ncbi:chromosome partition protein Smc [Clostridia bacterium]|nr:chromosome partition protein Smc [Clostridia bacterium]